MKTKQERVAYLINDRKYEFSGVRIKDGHRYGYCAKRKKWAYLFDSYVQFEGETPIIAKKL